MGLEQESYTWKEVCLPKGNILKSNWKEKLFSFFEEKSLSWKTFGTLRKQKTLPPGEFYCNMPERNILKPIIILGWFWFFCLNK